ncbi:MAG: competence protein ComK [Tissierellia bacterium]|nr:competence protein ComK [Tissierellia bacterium]
MDNIMAILPYEISKVGVGSIVFFLDGYKVYEKIPTNILKNLCSKYNVSIKSSNKNLKSFYNISRNYPWIINSKMSFFGFKYRKSSIDDQRGFVNSYFVKFIDDSGIHLLTGEVISFLNSTNTVIRNYMVADYFRLKFLDNPYSNIL